MKIVHELPNRAYFNVMELLVAEELEKQIHGLPPRVLKYLKRVEVETYALNRLPSLYASSEKGWQHQYERAKREFRNQIKSAVRQAIAAVQVDPIRMSKPLKVNSHEDAQVALNALRELLRQPELSWDGVVKRVKLIVTKVQGGQGATPTSAQTTHSAAERRSTPEHSRRWRPGTYGAEVSWKRQQATRSTDFDWDDSRYSK